MTNPVGGFTKRIKLDVVVDTNPYGSGDVVGGLIEIPGVFRSQGGTAVLQDIFVVDRSDQDAPLEILLFNEEPSQSYVDQVAAPAMVADASRLVGRLSVGSGDYSTIVGLATATLTGLNRTLQAGKGLTSLWAVIVVVGTPTFTGADHLSITMGFLQD